MFETSVSAATRHNALVLPTWTRQWAARLALSGIFGVGAAACGTSPAPNPIQSFAISVECADTTRPSVVEYKTNVQEVLIGRDSIPYKADFFSSVIRVSCTRPDGSQTPPTGLQILPSTAPLDPNSLKIEAQTREGHENDTLAAELVTPAPDNNLTGIISIPNAIHVGGYFFRQPSAHQHPAST